MSRPGPLFSRVVRALLAPPGVEGARGAGDFITTMRGIVWCAVRVDSAAVAFYLLARAIFQP